MYYSWLNKYKGRADAESREFRPNRADAIRFLCRMQYRYYVNSCILWDCKYRGYIILTYIVCMHTSCTSALPDTALALVYIPFNCTLNGDSKSAHGCTSTVGMGWYRKAIHELRSIFSDCSFIFTAQLGLFSIC